MICGSICNETSVMEQTCQSGKTSQNMNPTRPHWEAIEGLLFQHMLLHLLLYEISVIKLTMFLLLMLYRPSKAVIALKFSSPFENNNTGTLPDSLTLFYVIADLTENLQDHTEQQFAHGLVDFFSYRLCDSYVYQIDRIHMLQQVQLGRYYMSYHSKQLNKKQLA